MTKVRHEVVAVTAVMSVLLYLDRFCISFAEIFIKEDLGLSDVQVGWMLSAFFWSYALAQVPSGWLTDRFGARTMLTLYILLWSLFTALTGLATGFVMLFALRLGFGLGQAGAYPTAASLLSRWVPLSNRATASGIVSSGGRLGAVLYPVLTAYLIVLLVPVGVSSLLEPDDLLDPPRLGYLLLHGQESGDPKAADPALPRLGSRIISLLPTPAVRAVEEAASLYTPPPKKGEKEAKPVERRTLPPEQVERLVDGLNLVLARPDFYQRELFAKLSPEKEAKRLLDRDRESLDDRQVARLNRLLLEAAYPQAIKKVYGRGWRWMMLIYGLAGILIANLFWLRFRNQPRQHPGVDQAELALIESGRAAETGSGAVRSVPLRGLATSTSMWLNCLTQFTTNVGWVFIVTWLPRYLESVHKVPVEERALMVLTPVLVGWVGMLLGGKLADWFTRRVGLRWGRALPLGLSRFLAMASYLILLLEPSPWVAVAAFSMVAFFCDLGVPAIWAYVQDVGGRHVGSVLGWGNMWGNLGAAVTPPLLIWIVNSHAHGDEKNWTSAFLVCAFAFLISGLAGLGIDATKPIRSEED